MDLVERLAPQPGLGVDLHQQAGQRPAGERGGLTDIDLAADPTRRDVAMWLSPADVGEIVVRAIRNDDFYAITHPGALPRVEERHEGIRAAFLKYPPIKPRTVEEIE